MNLYSPFVKTIAQAQNKPNIEFSILLVTVMILEPGVCMYMYNQVETKELPTVNTMYDHHVV